MMSELVQDSIGDRDRSKIVRRMSAVVLLLLLIVLAQGWQLASGMTVKSQSWDYIIEGPTDDQLQSRLQALGAAGWELVSARRATAERNGRTEGIYEMIFQASRYGKRRDVANAAIAAVTATARLVGVQRVCAMRDRLTTDYEMWANKRLQPSARLIVTRRG